MKNLFTILFSLFSFMGLFAQSADYEFTTFIEEYEALKNPMPLTDGVWDDPSFTIPLGFDFIFHGDTVNTLNSNDDITGGQLYLGDGNSTGVNIMIAYGSDIIDLGYSNGKSISTISYEISGEPGAQIAKIEWNNVGFYDEVAENNTANNSLSFQAWFYEGTNDIEVRFGPNAVKNFLLHEYGGPMIGMISNFNTNFSTFDTLTTLDGNPTMPEVKNTIDLNNVLPVLDDNPEDGRVYKFGYKVQDFPTNIKSTHLLGNVEIYPTIVENNIQINLEEELLRQDVKLFIYNVIGQEMMQKVLLTQNQSVNLNNLEKGNYFVKIQVDDQYEVKKIMKL